MLLFKGDDLRPVLAEAIANKCQVILAKDDGVYFMSEKCERTSEGNPKHIAYAVGCNPTIDAFDDWWDLAGAELGGSDFGEFFDPQESVFARIVKGGCDLKLAATATHLCIEPVSPGTSNC